MEPIIKSILDSDLYKFTMQMAVVELFPRAKVRYTFINRGKTPFPEGFAEELRRQTKHMESLYLTKKEKKFLLEKCYFMTPTYIDFLYGYRYDSSEVGIIQKGDVLEITIEGYWHRTILWEVPLMALISELFFKMTNAKPYSRSKREENNLAKSTKLKMNNILYADFGTRRRFSYEVHEELVSDFVNSSLHNNNFVGTSNVHLAEKYNIKPIGTHAHEWFMFHAAKYGYKMANYLAMENWTKVFRGDLGIALPDTFTTNVFLKSFDRKFAKLYDGARQDSGNPNEFSDKFASHYDSLGIDRASKSIVYSDSLDVDKAINACNYGRSLKFKTSAGIGTHFTNDVGVTPLNMVIKLAEAKPEGDEWIKCIKKSDDSGKTTGDEKENEIANYVLKIPS